MTLAYQSTVRELVDWLCAANNEQFAMPIVHNAARPQFAIVSGQHVQSRESSLSQISDKNTTAKLCQRVQQLYQHSPISWHSHKEHAWQQDTACLLLVEPTFAIHLSTLCELSQYQHMHAALLSYKGSVRRPVALLGCLDR